MGRLGFGELPFDPMCGYEKLKNEIFKSILTARLTSDSFKVFYCFLRQCYEATNLLNIDWQDGTKSSDFNF